MAKKGKGGSESTGRSAGQGREPFSLLSVRFDNLDTGIIRQHIIYLVAASLLTKFLVLALTPTVFHSFIDFFDIQFYFDQGVKILGGQLPYIGYNFEYPVLVFIPIIIALIPAVIFQNGMVFAYTFQLLMVICDLVILLCVYLTALKMKGEKTAFYAGLIYATAFSTAYFVLTKYDAFPTAFLMLAIFFTTCGLTMRGYCSAGLGFFAKIFPVVSLPFLVLHNTKKSSLKDEIVSALKVMIPLCVVLLLPILIIRPGAIGTYLFATGATVGVYVNTLTYTLYAWLGGVLHTGITPENVSLVMYLLMGLCMLVLLWSAYTDTEKRPVTLVKTLLCALLIIVVFTKFHSPQYIVWYTPLLCLLVADDIYKIALFYVVQVLAFIEFPLMFGSFYTNLEYTNAAGTPGWYLTLAFFTVQYLALLALVLMILAPKKGLVPGLREKFFSP
ncbi:MAG: hypothetical protein GYA23_12285 [Methanomicrobiales archaeon]|nr:hypothetical protein [Methanomicrobiales archaeon]